jgi:uncharacterized protein YndB with AHSA1/START domain
MLLPHGCFRHVISCKMPQKYSTCVSRVISAPIETIYAAFMDPAALLAWLPPVPMTGQIHAFNARVGGGYEMSLFYPPEERTLRGRTADREDRVSVRFLELTPPHRIVEAVRFHSDDPAFGGEMTVNWMFGAVAGGTEVTVPCENLPPGLRAEDNEAGSRISLEQLALWVELG